MVSVRDRGPSAGSFTWLQDKHHPSADRPDLSITAAKVPASSVPLTPHGQSTKFSHSTSNTVLIRTLSGLLARSCSLSLSSFCSVGIMPKLHVDCMAPSLRQPESGGQKNLLLPQLLFDQVTSLSDLS